MKRKVLEYDVLRVILTIFVVIGHSTYFSQVTAFGNISIPLNENFTLKSNIIYSIISKLGDWIYTFHMPLFFALSGAILALTIDRYTNYSVFIRKKIARLIIPYLLAGVCFMIPIKLLSGFYDLSNLNLVISSYLSSSAGESGHLWFLPSLFFCLITFYLIVKLAKNNKVLILMVCLILSGLAAYIPAVNIPLWQNPFSNIFWLALGYAFESKREWWNVNVCIKGKSLILISAIISILNGQFAFLPQIFAVIVSGIFVYGISYYLSNVEIIMKNKVYLKMQKYSFEIFLFHDPINFAILFVIGTYGMYHLFSNWLILLVYWLIRVFGNIIICIILGYGIYSLKRLFQINKIKVIIECLLVIFFICILIYVYAFSTIKLYI